MSVGTEDTGTIVIRVCLLRSVPKFHAAIVSKCMSTLRNLAKLLRFCGWRILIPKGYFVLLKPLKKVEVAKVLEIATPREVRKFSVAKTDH
ncbi:hypothetical protein BaRGS_00013022 [Batillaria attramentaria]|uniref:Uncharacterized protein n=1 Tax=Batillaria attramentaria TaxID=370345 RepID=A0ABD0L8V9_9CAEN